MPGQTRKNDDTSTNTPAPTENPSSTVDDPDLPDSWPDHYEAGERNLHDSNWKGYR